MASYSGSMCSCVHFTVLFLLALATHCSATAQNVLVLVDDLAVKDSHSMFFTALQQRGYSLEYRLLDDPTLQLRDWEKWLYSKMAIFGCAGNGLGGTVDVASLLEFIDAGNDVLLATDSCVSPELRELALECGIDIEPAGLSAVDYFDYQIYDPALLAADNYVHSAAVLGPEPIQAPVLYSGAAMSIAEGSHLAFKVLTAPVTAVCHVRTEPLVQSPALGGHNMVLVAASQTRSNSRVVASGSMSLFSNANFDSPVRTAQGRKFDMSGNQMFATQISKWAFHEHGVLKAENMRHHFINSTDEPAFYRINDEVEFEVDILELADGSWRPFRANDVQVEFVMLDPHIRKTLISDEKGHFSAKLKLPDVYGVFKFVIDYKRLGLTHLVLEKVVPVRPYKHNEYERFLVAAYPYYASSVSMMISFFVFGFFFLYHK